MKAIKSAFRMIALVILLTVVGVIAYVFSSFEFVFGGLVGDIGVVDADKYTFHNTLRYDFPPPQTLSYAEYRGPAIVDPDKADALNGAYAVNNHTVAWLSVGDTKINFPVVHYIDNDYYLRRGLDRKYSFQGVVFADYRNSFGGRNELSRNTVLYGHNTTDDRINGKMFAQLLNYSDEQFAEDNQIIDFYTSSDGMRWQVFAAFYTDTEFYYIYTQPSDMQFLELIDEAKQRSEFIFNVDVTPVDKMLTLSTCTYKWGKRDDQRFVVMAKLLAADETPTIKPISVNPSPKLPSFVKE